MKIWIARNAPDAGSLPALSLGVIGAGGLTPLTPGDAKPAEAAAWLLPAGQALAPDLLSALAEEPGDVYATVNGLAKDGIAALRECLGPSRLILTFDLSVGEADLAFTEQLGWLSHQPERFAVMARNDDALLAATLAGAQALLIEDGGEIDFGPLSRLAALRAPDAGRPVGPLETELLSGRELCLTVRRPLAAGSVISDSDLAVAVTEYRGLAPTLRDAVIGATLRYDIAPGEALHFGHIQ